jgi:hypothetical protein
MASVKNFQLIAAPAPLAAGAAASAQPRPSSSSSGHDTVILQFGKVSKDTFTMDYRPVPAVGLPGFRHLLDQLRHRSFSFRLPACSLKLFKRVEVKMYVL